MRTTRKTVTFEHSFHLDGLDGSQPPGDYSVITDEEEIPGLSFVAWRRVGTSFRLPALENETGQEQWIGISPKDLSTALAADRQ